MNDPLISLRLTDAFGAPIAHEDIEVVRCVKDEAGEPRRAYRIEIRGEPMLLKLQTWHTWKSILRATLGQSYLDRELRMSREAKWAGLTVNRFGGRAIRRRCGCVVEQGLILEWIEGGRPVELTRDRRAVVALFAKVRHAGFADKDFGVHNIVVTHENVLVWTDLERAYRARPNDADATARTAASLLARWWELCRGDVRAFHDFSADVCDAAPEPDGGWRAVVERLNPAMMNKCDELIRRGRLDRRPPMVSGA